MPSYLELDRPIGEGKLRIGDSIPIGEDIFSMLFVSCIHSRYIYYADYIAPKLEEEKNDEKAQLV